MSYQPSGQFTVTIAQGEGGGGNTEPREHESLWRSGPLGRYNDPFGTNRDAVAGYPLPWASWAHNQASSFHGALFGGVRIIQSRIQKWGKHWGLIVLKPHTKSVQRWNQFFVISCLLAAFIDPLFLLLFSVKQTYFCISYDAPFAKVVTGLRTITDFIYFLHMLLQFKLAYIKPASRTLGMGELVLNPRELANHYLHGWFLLDLFSVLPMPQVMFWLVVDSGKNANSVKNILRVTLLLQYLPRIFRFLPLAVGTSQSGFIFETAWANFGIHLLIYFLAAHVVGSCWYLFGLQRVNECLRTVCKSENSIGCIVEYLDCRDGKNIITNDTINLWRNSSQASSRCLDGGQAVDFSYGIYTPAVLVTMSPSVFTKYFYSLFWGFLQISTLGGNLVPSLFVWEVLFTMAIIGLGLLLFAYFIGNVQAFLQSLGRRQMDMQLRRHDVEEWMKRRNLSPELRRKVRQAERYKWAATRGVDENELLEGLPEDLHRDIRRKLALSYVKKVRMFQVMEEDVLDAICERLEQTLYIGGSVLMQPKYPIDQMLFIVRGRLLSIGDDGSEEKLSAGDFCGEELLIWCFKHAAIPVGSEALIRKRVFSNRSVRCLTNVEAFSLHASDLEFVVKHFSRHMRNPRVQGAIRYESSYFKTWAARRIQAAWRARRRVIKRSTQENMNGNLD